MNAVWFLVFAFSSDGGAITIPQASQADCQRQVDYIHAHLYDHTNLGPRWAYCAYGVR